MEQYITIPYLILQMKQYFLRYSNTIFATFLSCKTAIY